MLLAMALGLTSSMLTEFFNYSSGLTVEVSIRGLGLDLAICERVAANHGGGISMISKPGHGSTFTVFFPVD